MIFELLGSNDPTLYSRIVTAALEGAGHVPYDRVAVLGPARKPVAENAVTVNSDASKVTAHEVFPVFRLSHRYHLFCPEVAKRRGTFHHGTCHRAIHRVYGRYPDFVAKVVQKGLYLTQTWAFRLECADETWAAKYALGKDIVAGDALEVQKKRRSKCQRTSSEDVEFTEDNGLKVRQHKKPFRLHSCTSQPSSSAATLRITGSTWLQKKENVTTKSGHPGYLSTFSTTMASVFQTSTSTMFEVANEIERPSV